MESDGYYTLDARAKSTDLCTRIRHDLLARDYVKVHCEPLPGQNDAQLCLKLIESIGGVACPYGKDPQACVWPVKVMALESEPASVHLPGTNVDRELHFHTDCSFERHAPDFIALFVVAPDRSEQGGKFQLVRTAEVLRQLSAETKEILRGERFKFIVRPAYRKEGQEAIWLPILLDDERMRYQPDLIDKKQLEGETWEKQQAIEELNAVIFNEEKLNVFRPKLERHMMVLFNNHRFLHGRTKIQDVDRHLLRIRFNLKTT